MTRTYKYRIEQLTPAQHGALKALFRHLGWLRNLVIERYRERHAAGEKAESFYDACRWLAALRAVDGTMSQWASDAQRGVLKAVRLGYECLFRKQGGRPRFRKIDEGVRSFPVGHSCKPRAVRGDLHAVSVKGVGKLRFRDRRGVLLLDGARLRQCRIVRRGRHYDIALVVELPDPGKADERPLVGIDLGLNALMTFDNGDSIPPLPGGDRQRQRRLDRRLARAKPGSAGRRHKRASRAAFLRKEAARRRGRLHRITAAIIQGRSGHVGLEDLSVRNMTKAGGRRKRGLNRRIREQCWGEIREMLSYKAEGAGGMLVLVDPRNTTQRCHRCGNVKEGSEKLKLKDRNYNCSKCGLVMDRDWNAAINIVRLAEELCRERRQAALSPGGNPPARRANQTTNRGPRASASAEVKPGGRRGTVCLGYSGI